MSKRYKVTIRREGFGEVRENALQINGMCFDFTEGFMMGEGDRYPGECAMIPDDPCYPKSAPPWIASGDLIEDDSEDVTAADHARDEMTEDRAPTPDDECPYECQDCGEKLVDVGGYWGCLCLWGGRMPTPEMIEEWAV
jgi:hypothetical protein